MKRQHKRQRKITKPLRYVIRIDDMQAYRFTFKEGTLFNKVKREMRAVAKAFGYTPYELFTKLKFYELLTKPETVRLMEEERINDEAAKEE